MSVVVVTRVFLRDPPGARNLIIDSVEPWRRRESSI